MDLTRLALLGSSPAVTRATPEARASLIPRDVMALVKLLILRDVPALVSGPSSAPLGGWPSAEPCSAKSVGGGLALPSVRRSRLPGTKWFENPEFGIIWKPSFFSPPYCRLNSRVVDRPIIRRRFRATRKPAICRWRTALCQRIRRKQPEYAEPRPGAFYSSSITSYIT